MIKDFIKLFYDKCFACKRKRFFLRKREVPMPGTNLIAKSREKFCGGCHQNILKELSKGHNHD